MRNNPTIAVSPSALVKERSSLWADLAQVTPCWLGYCCSKLTTMLDDSHTGHLRWIINSSGNSVFRWGRQLHPRRHAINYGTGSSCHPNPHRKHQKSPLDLHLALIRLEYHIFRGPRNPVDMHPLWEYDYLASIQLTLSGSLQILVATTIFLPAGSLYNWWKLSYRSCMVVNALPSVQEWVIATATYIVTTGVHRSLSSTCVGVDLRTAGKCHMSHVTHHW